MHFSQKQIIMELLGIIRYAIIGVVVSLVMLFINRAASKQVEANPEGQRVLKPNALYMVVGWMGIALGFFSIVVMVMYWEREVLAPAILLALLMGGGGYSLLLYYRNHRLAFDDEMIMITGWTGKRTEIRWVDINNIKYNLLSGYVKIYGLGQKANIHFQMVGLKSFLDMMEQKTKWRARDLRIPIR